MFVQEGQLYNRTEDDAHKFPVMLTFRLRPILFLVFRALETSQEVVGVVLVARSAILNAETVTNRCSSKQIYALKTVEIPWENWEEIVLAEPCIPTRDYKPLSLDTKEVSSVVVERWSVTLCVVFMPFPTDVLRFSLFVFVLLYFWFNDHAQH